LATAGRAARVALDTALTVDTGGGAARRRRTNLAALPAVGSVVLGVHAQLAAGYESGRALEGALPAVAAGSRVCWRHAYLAAATAVRGIRCQVDASAVARSLRAAIRRACAGLADIARVARAAAFTAVRRARVEIDAFARARIVAGVTSNAALAGLAPGGTIGRTGTDLAAGAAVLRVTIQAYTGCAAGGVALIAG